MSWEYIEGMDEEMDCEMREACGDEDEDLDDGLWMCGDGGPDC